jgi:hypothetical protein
MSRKLKQNLKLYTKEKTTIEVAYIYLYFFKCRFYSFMVLRESIVKKKRFFPRILVPGILMRYTRGFRYSFYNSLKKLGRP